MPVPHLLGQESAHPSEPRLCGAHFLPRGCTQPRSPSSVGAASPADLGLTPRDWLWSCSEGFGRPSLSAKGGQGHRGGSGSAPRLGASLGECGQVPNL